MSVGPKGAGVEIRQSNNLMNKTLIAVIVIVSLAACDWENDRAGKEKDAAQSDSMQRAKLMDTVNMKTCPVAITFSSLGGGARIRQ